MPPSSRPQTRPATRSAPAAPPGPGDRASRVDRAVADIRALHALGVDLLRRTVVPAGESAHGKTPFEETRKARGLDHETTLRKAKQFAELYTARDLDRLVRAIRRAERKAKPDAPVFGASAVKVLLTAGPDRVDEKDVADLHAWQETALRKRWSTAELEAAIRAAKPRLRAGGRRPKLPTDPAGLRVRIWSACRAWQRLSKAVAVPPHSESLSPALRRRLAAADAAVAEVLAAVEGWAGWTGERPRPPRRPR